tara:strand:+ start:10701 stop:11552 length:852 start_codon:yes stop_codon:yes gene_type:complete
MVSSQPLQLRWIWLAIYSISGCLILAYAAFAALGVLPSGVFYVGFGLAGFVGALIAAAHSSGAGVVETSIAAVLVGLLNLTLLVFGLAVNSSHSPEILPQLAEPLSTTFVCFVGALAGGQFANRRTTAQSERETLPFLSFTAIVTLVGASASHAAVIAILASASTTLASILGIFLLFTTPATAGYALQLTTARNVTSAFVWGITAVGGLAFLVCAALAFGYGWDAYAKSLLCGGLLGLFGGLTLVFILPGICFADTSRRKQALRGTRLPKAFARIAARVGIKP